MKQIFTPALLLLASTLLRGENGTIPGELTTPFPTVENLSIEWMIEGDQNENAAVSLRYREKSSSEWITGFPLRRTTAGSGEGHSWPNRFAGSLFNLTPATEYEIALSLNDPDGGSLDTVLSCATRAVPTVPAGADIITYPTGNHGEISVESGTESSPKVYRAEPGARFSRINMYGKEWVYLEGLKIEGTSKGIVMNNSRNCVVRACTLSTPSGILAYADGITDCYIADNVLIGNARWNKNSMGSGGYNGGEGIEFTGAGNVVCYNSVTGYRDGISTMEDDLAKNQRSNDIHNNIISVGTDDGIEADFLIANNRVYRNMILNSFVGISSQPGLGGPNYFYENVMYNIPFCSYKLNRGSVGDVVFNNTVLKSGDGMTIRTSDPVDRSLFRNNLSIGGGPGGTWGGYGGGSGFGAMIQAATDRCDFDYDAVGSMNGKGDGTIAGVSFSDREPHGVSLGNLSSLNTLFENALWPGAVDSIYTMPDLRLRSSSAVVDQGEVIPGFHRSYNGSAPDIGAYEWGTPLPHYGPRSGNGTAVSKNTGTYRSGSAILMSGRTVTLTRGNIHAVTLFSLQGKILFQSETAAKAVTLPSAIARGIYTVQVKSDRVITEKIIIP